MGGAVALMVGHEGGAGAARTPPVVGIATDCAFASLRGVLHHAVESTLRLPHYAAGVVCDWAVRVPWGRFLACIGEPPMAWMYDKNQRSNE
jgi:hypothetical protein